MNENSSFIALSFILPENPLLPRNCKSYESCTEVATVGASADGKTQRVGLMLKPGDLSVLPKIPLSREKESFMKVRV